MLWYNSSYSLNLKINGNIEMIAIYLSICGFLTYIIMLIYFAFKQNKKKSIEKESMITKTSKSFQFSGKVDTQSGIDQSTILDISAIDSKQPKPKPKFKKPNEDPESLNSTTIKRPKFKRNLTIQIPASPQYKDLKKLQDQEKEFIFGYFKEQCYPLSFYYSHKETFKRTSMITIWWTGIFTEFFLVLLLFYEDLKPGDSAGKFVLYPIISCMGVLPVGFALTPLFRDNGSIISIILNLLGYIISWIAMIAVCLSSFILELDDEISFVVAFGICLFIEIAVMEPIKTIVKAAGYLWFKEQNIMAKFCIEI
ncbi:unnamed protein product [Blepharisma stoltei]|uniref:Uncharacterized protein n=1 Tax=Blepharisma stoltei TaxID=1481888 RepID=A0AAU9IET2_9CILI|nr:unnamed protein product [Blepharisma stoltei]